LFMKIHSILVQKGKKCIVPITRAMARYRLNQ